MDNMSPNTTLDPNHVLNGSPLPYHEANVNHQCGYENQNEEFSGDESMRSIVTEREEEDQEDDTMVDVQVQDDIPEGWKYVEVVGSFDQIEMEGGGGFVLRDWEDTALLAQAFPAPGDSLLYVEAFVLHKAMEKIIALREEEVVFCLESEALFGCLYGRCIVPADIRSMIQDCIDWWAKGHLFHVVLWKREELEAAVWLGICGRRCQQHCQWDGVGPWPPELDVLM